MGHNMCFERVIRKIIPKLFLLLLIILSTDFLENELLTAPGISKNNWNRPNPDFGLVSFRNFVMTNSKKIMYTNECVHIIWHILANICRIFHF